MSIQERAPAEATLADLTNGYCVTVRREGDLWVARDRNGDWRCRCGVWHGKTAAEAMRAMFHADELGSVEANDGDTATAVISRA